jgi:selenocysteine-specific elongation factor
VLQEPALLLPGDRFIIRMFSPVVTIGGGIVIDPGERRYRKADNVVARLDILAAPDTAMRVALLVKESPFGLGLPELVARTGLREREIADAANRAPLMTIPPAWIADRSWFQAARARLVQTVREFHQKQPLQPGIAKQDLRSREMAKAPPFVMDALLAAATELVVEGETVRSRGHTLVLKQDEEKARAAIESAFERGGLATPAMAEVLAKSGVEPARARTLMQILLREKLLVKIADDLVFHQSAIEKLRAMLAGRKGERFAVGAFKEWTGVSRKYAIPLLEFLDRERVTRRDGDERVVL